MKKIILTFVILFLVTFSIFSQSTTITPGAALPQMTTAQRTVLASPINGMLVFDTNTSSYWFYQQTTWVELPKGGSTANYWELNGLNGNEIKNTNSGGFWSANPAGLNLISSDTSNPPTSPVNGDGTRFMWIPSRSAFRIGTIDGNRKSWDADSVGLFSMALGYNLNATGKFSIALGGLNHAKGLGATALGAGTWATGDYSMSMGNATISSGDYASSMGRETKAIGIGATSMGHNSEAIGKYSTAMGSYSEANGNYSTAMGIFTEAKAYGGTTIGQYNDNTDSPTASLNPNDRIFQLGNGNYNGGSFIRTNAMTVLRNGNTGTYNVVDPKANLHLEYNSSLNWDAHLRLQYSPTQWGNIVYDFDGLKFKTWGSGDDFYFRNSVNTTTARIYDTGNMTIAGTLTQNSDRRLKKNLIQLNDSAKKIEQLKGFQYNWIAKDRDQGVQTGLIAQEVKTLFPELVSSNEDGYLAVNYIGLIPHIIEAFKELKKENEILKASSNESLNRMASMEEKLNFLLAESAKKGMSK